jgi:hypothetical protein
MIRERDEKREVDPQDPDVALLNDQIKNTIKVEARKTWREAVSSSDPKANPDKF